jgi:sterol desaturase/sphingolipid hydroxylase (fatty acid hydroxylase superfamily)
MDQFGVHMNFLGFIQILALIFILKIYFLFIFLDFLIYWVGRQILEKAGSLAQESARHSE